MKSFYEIFGKTFNFFVVVFLQVSVFVKKFLTNFGNSLKSIRKHKIISPFKKIGSSDLSTHVNFNLIKKISNQFNLVTHGPINQKNFLINLGIMYRAKTLFKNANNNQKKNLEKGLDFLINEKKMGKIFNVISISNKNINKLTGF